MVLEEARITFEPGRVVLNPAGGELQNRSPRHRRNGHGIFGLTKWNMAIGRDLWIIEAEHDSTTLRKTDLSTPARQVLYRRQQLFVWHTFWCNRTARSPS